MAAENDTLWYDYETEDTPRADVCLRMVLAAGAIGILAAAALALICL